MTTSQIGDTHNKELGFTLLETIIVLSILTMFFAISIPLFSKFAEKTKLDTAVRSVVSALRTARSYAITNNADYYVFFKKNSQHQYFISDRNIGDLSNPNVSIIEKIYRLPTGIEFGSVGFTKGTTGDGACFRPTGELDETASDTAIEITDGEETKTITVERTTGRAKIE